MSEENVDLVRRLLEMFAKREHEAVFAFYAPDIEWDAAAWESIAAAPADVGGGIAGLAAVYRGHEGVRTYWRRWLEAWKDLEFEVEDVLDAGDEVVALIRNQRQWGRHSGIVTEMPPYGLVFTIRGGKVVRWRAYSDQQSALEAAGMSEFAMSQENVETLRRAVEAFDRGAENEWIAAWLPDAELYDFTELPDVPQPYRGHEGVRRWATNVRSVLGDFRMKPRGFTRIEDAILMDLEVRGVGEQSGVPVGMTVYVLAWIQGGKIARTRAFLDRAEALEAAGLSE